MPPNVHEALEREEKERSRPSRGARPTFQGEIDLRAEIKAVVKAELKANGHTSPSRSPIALEPIGKILELIEDVFTHDGRNLSRKKDRALTAESDAGRVFVALLSKKAPPFTGRKLHNATSELRHALGKDMVKGEGESISLAVAFNLGPTLKSRIS